MASAQKALHTCLVFKKVCASYAAAAGDGDTIYVQQSSPNTDTANLPLGGGG